MKVAFDVRNDSTKELKKLNQSLGPQMLLANSTHSKQPSQFNRCLVVARIVARYEKIRTEWDDLLTKNRVTSKRRECKECFERLHNLVNLDSHGSFEGRHTKIMAANYVVEPLRGTSFSQHN